MNLQARFAFAARNLYRKAAVFDRSRSLRCLWQASLTQWQAGALPDTTSFAYRVASSALVGAVGAFVRELCERVGFFGVFGDANLGPICRSHAHADQALIQLR
jgi:hypothetical protein